MRLPIPVEVDGEIYTDAKIGRAESLAVAKTTDEAKRGDIYSAILEWCAGVLEELSGDAGIITGADLRRSLRAMPFESAYAIAMHGMAVTKKDDSISGSYPCPKCQTQVTAETKEIDGEIIDDADHLYTLDIGTLDTPKDGLAIELKYPVILKKRESEEVIEEVTSLVMEWPTLGQCIRAYQRCPDSDMRMQFLLYADALRSVNGTERNRAWKEAAGVRIFEKMDAKDTAQITAMMKQYSVNVSKERVCIKCHHRWEAPLDFGNFFASGLGN